MSYRLEYKTENNKTYTSLFKDDVLVMSDEKFVTNHYEFLKEIKGRVLMTGLGIGYVIKYLLDNNDIEYIHVIEKEQEIIDLIKPLVSNPKVTIIKGDAFDPNIKELKDLNFNSIIHDIFTYISSDTKESIKQLEEMYKEVAPNHYSPYKEASSKLNPIMPNTFKEIDIDYNKLIELTSEYVDQFNKDIIDPGFSTMKPGWHGDIAWIGSTTEKALNFFETCYDIFDVEKKTKEMFNVSEELKMYSGFFIIRTYANDTVFHQDFIGESDNAFTLITPIQLPENAGHLLYKEGDETKTYTYKKGKAIIFNKDFNHSTQPFKSDKNILFCFHYGTHNLERWKSIKLTILGQGSLVRHPSGKLLKTV